MPQPTGTDPTWATDTNFASGTESGLSTKVEPSAGQIAQGDVAGLAAPAVWSNWWKNKVGQWITYLKNLNTDSDFLNFEFHWVATHEFDSTIVAGGGINSGGELLYDPAILRENVQLPLSGGQGNGSFTCAGEELVQTGDGALWNISFRLPRGAVLRSVEALYEKDSSASGATAGQLAVSRAEKDWATPAATSYNSLGTANATASTSPQKLSVTGLSETFDENDVLWCTLSGLTTLSTNDAKFWGLRMSFDDPGPRNF